MEGLRDFPERRFNAWRAFGIFPKKDLIFGELSEFSRKVVLHLGRLRDFPECYINYKKFPEGAGNGRSVCMNKLNSSDRSKR